MTSSGKNSAYGEKQRTGLRSARRLVRAWPLGHIRAFALNSFSLSAQFKNIYEYMYKHIKKDTKLCSPPDYVIYKDFDETVRMDSLSSHMVFF